MFISLQDKLLQENNAPLLQENGCYILLSTSILGTTETSTKSTVGISEKVTSTLLYAIPPETSLCVDMKSKTVSAS